MSLVQQSPPHTIESFENDKGYFIKTFLLDDSTARNGMGVTSEYIPKHIHKFVGKPVILTPDFYHPHEFEHYSETGDPTKDLTEYTKLQTPYIIGTIASVDTSSNLQQAGGTKYSAILQISDQKAISSFKQGKIPLYVSPSIYRVNSKDPIHSITDYEPLHIAIVDNPAYGFHKANIRAHCQGDKIECGRMLAQASNGLGYCVEKKLSELKNVFSASMNSSYSEKPLFRSVETLENNNNENAQTSVQQEQPKVEQEQKQEQVKAAPSVEQTIQEQKAAIEQARTPINTPAPAQPAKAQEETKQEQPKVEQETPCAKAQADYEAKIAELENDIKSFKEFKSNYEKTSAETKLQSKRSRIENVVPQNYASSEEERIKAVDSLMNVADEQLDTILNSFVIPATKNVRQAGIRRPKVTDFVKEDNGKNVAQASVGPRVSERDMENLEKILNFGIVPKKNNNTSGGIA